MDYGKIMPLQRWLHPVHGEKIPNTVLKFYNERRKNILQAKPNNAHLAIASLEQNYEVTVITQNIDDLHEKRGSAKVMHLHGEIFKMRSEKNEALIYPVKHDIQIGDCADDDPSIKASYCMV